MTLKELEERVIVRRARGGGYRIDITYRGKDYHCHSNDTLAYDTLVSYWNGDKTCYWYRTAKHAYIALYDDCKRANHLGEYKY